MVVSYKYLVRPTLQLSLHFLLLLITQLNDGSTHFNDLLLEKITQDCLVQSNLCYQVPPVREGVLVNGRRWEVGPFHIAHDIEGDMNHGTEN